MQYRWGSRGVFPSTWSGEVDEVEVEVVEVKEFYFYFI
jgi:hypothetical protein